MGNTAIVGINWGDEGKGRITANTETPPQDLLLRRGSLYAETAENLGLTVIRK